MSIFIFSLKYLSFVLRITGILYIPKFISGISGSKNIIDDKLQLKSDYKLLMSFDLQHDLKQVYLIYFRAIIIKKQE